MTPMMDQTRGYRPGEHRSRREIDMAIGVLMGIRRCSAQGALEELVAATRLSGVGLGAVSHALLNIIDGEAEIGVCEVAAAHWNALLSSPTHRGD